MCQLLDFSLVFNCYADGTRNIDFMSIHLRNHLCVRDKLVANGNSKLEVWRITAKGTIYATGE